MLQVQADCLLRKHGDGAKYKTILPLTREEWEWILTNSFLLSKPVLLRRDGFLIYLLKLPLLGHQAPITHNGQSAELRK